MLKVSCMSHLRWCLLFFFLRSLSLDVEEEELDDDSLLLSSLESWLACANNSAYFFSNNNFGASLRNCLRSSVRAPRPILVKKLIENLAFCTLSLGNTPARCCYNVSTLSLLTSPSIPRFSLRSWNRILMKMRELDVVSSSVRRMMERHDQLMASV